jgi:hypothetical protein
VTNYGLSKYQISKAKEKLQRNKDFMNSHGIQIDNKIVPFSDFVANSYVNSNRYIAELQHRAWSVYEYANSKELHNVFITLTLPSEWHKKKTHNQKLVTNPKFGGRKYITTINGYKFYNCHVIQNIPFIEPILDFSQTIEKYTPRGASIELSNMFKRFRDDRAYKNIDKDNRIYFRVTEPHKDGTPHLHISLFVPVQNVDAIVKSLARLFPAPASKVEINVESPVSYLMKYVLKTLDDLRENSEKISNLTLWYLYHGISRFYTSRTFVALEVYRRLNGMYSLIDLTKKYNSSDIEVYQCTQTKKISYIKNEYGFIYNKKPVDWYDKFIDIDHTYLEADFKPIFREKTHKLIDMWIDGEQYIYFNGHAKKSKKYPWQMNNYQLHDYFHSLDIDTCNDEHFIVTRNLMIDRGLLYGEIMPTSSINQLMTEFELEGAF